MKMGQRAKERVMGVSTEVLERLLRQIRQNPDPHVFPANGALSKLFDRILERADIPKFDELGRKLTAHSFRHTYATFQAEAVSANPFLLKEILGHSQLSTTERYCHPRMEATVVDVSDFVGGVKGGVRAEENG